MKETPIKVNEELKRPSDCWYVPVCRVWGDSKEDAQKDAASPEGSDFAAEEGYGEDGRGPEGSDFGAEEGGPDAEEGHEEVWDEVQEALSTMEHEEFDATAEAEQGLKRRDPLRHHPKRQCGLRMC